VLEIVPNAVTIVDNSDAVAAVVAAGGGIGISPTYIAAPYLHRRALVPVLKTFSVDRSNMTAHWQESRRQSERQGAGIVPRRGLSLATPWDNIFAEA